VEPWATVQPELAQLLPTHWREIALDQDVIPLDMDWEAYAELDRLGILHCVTARNDTGTLVGYFLAFLRGHLHYRTSLTAFEDMFYLDPAYRSGWTGVRFFQAVEAAWRARGVERAAISYKLHFRQGKVGKLLAYLGWQATETNYTKYLGTKRG
jgi:GNAT superfamily N-acetyltransferase